MDQNFDSNGVCGSIHFSNRDRKLWYEGTKNLQQDRHFNMFNSPSLTQNIDRYQLITDEISPMKLENPRKYTVQGESNTKTSFFKDKFALVKDRRSQTVTSLITDKPNSPQKEYGIRPQTQQKFIEIPATSTSYRTFYEPPREQQKKSNTMKPDFYQSAVPKYMNIGYITMAQGFEKQHYLHKKPAILRPREYSADGNFRKSQMVTSRRFRAGMSAKKYI